MKRVIAALDAAGIEYMLTGSLASSLQGEPRSTHDIDLVVALEADHVEALAGAFPSPDFYLDAEDARESITRSKMFNLIDARRGDKVDFWPLTASAFDRSRFSRRVCEPLFGIDVMVSSPEDTILAKLDWARQQGGSRKQSDDALRILEVQGERLDMAYLDHWARELDVEDAWGDLLRQAEAGD